MMNIYGKEGSKIIITENTMNNGSELDKIQLKRHLEVGKVYTVKHIRVYSWYSTVMLKEVPFLEFNTINFEDYVEEDEKINSLRLHVKKGDKVTITEKSLARGSYFEQVHVAKNLTYGNEYTVKGFSIETFRTLIVLEEFPDTSFALVCFDIIEKNNESEELDMSEKREIKKPKQKTVEVEGSDIMKGVIIYHTKENLVGILQFLNYSNKGTHGEGQVHIRAKTIDAKTLELVDSVWWSGRGGSNLGTFVILGNPMADHWFHDVLPEIIKNHNWDEE